MVVRNAIRFGLCAVALAGVQVGHAVEADASAFTGFMQRVTGANAVTVGIGSGGTMVATRPSTALGGTSGWSSAPNFGSGSVAGGGVRIGMRGDAVVAGAKVPVTVATPIARTALVDGLGLLVRNALKLSGPLSLAVMVADMAGVFDAAGVDLNTDPATKGELPFMADLEGGMYMWGSGDCRVAVATNAIMCTIARQNGIGTSALTDCRIDQQTDTSAGGSCKYVPTGGRLNAAVSRSFSPSLEKVPANWDQARQRFDNMETLPSEIAQKQIDWARKQAGQNGIEPWKVEVGTSTVTAPGSLPQVVKSDVKTSGNTTTTTTTTTDTAITTNGDQIKVSPTTTTTTTTKVQNADGSVTETTTSETTQTETNEDPSTKPEDTPGLCDLYPDILACAKPELDKPDTEIPREDRTITYEAENLFGEGACPADSMATLGTLQQTVKVWDWQKTCEYALPLRAIVLALASFAAFLIVMPGESRT